MKKNIASIIVALGVLLGYSLALAQSEEPFVGSWDIDLNASDFGGATPPKNMTRSYIDLGNGSYAYQVATVDQDDNLNLTSAIYTFSGEQYPIVSFDELPAPAMISYRKISSTTVEYTVRVGGEISQIGAKFISPNYQQLTISIQFPNSDQKNQVLIFNRRR